MKKVIGLKVETSNNTHVLTLADISSGGQFDSENDEIMCRIAEFADKNDFIASVTLECGWTVEILRDK